MTNRPDIEGMQARQTNNGIGYPGRAETEGRLVALRVLEDAVLDRGELLGEVVRLRAALVLCSGSIKQSLLKQHDAPASAWEHLQEALRVIFHLGCEDNPTEGTFSAEIHDLRRQANRVMSFWEEESDRRVVPDERAA